MVDGRQAGRCKDMVDGPGVPEPVAATVGGALTWDESCNGEPDAPKAAVNGGGSNGNVDLDRLVRLLTNEDTAGISERQLVVLRQVCKTRQRG